MTKQRVLSSTSTHFPNSEAVVVEKGEFGVKNAQGDMMLSYPDEGSDTGGNTHTTGDITFEGPKKVKTIAKKTTAAAKVVVKKRVVSQSMLRDQQKPTGGKIAEIPNDEDPAAGYLDEDDAGMPVIQNASADDEEFMEDMDGIEADVDEFGDDVDDVIEEAPEADLEIESEFEDFDQDAEEMTAEAEFEDLADLEGVDDAPVVAEDMEVTEEVSEDDPLPMDVDVPDTEAVAVVDVDCMDDADTSDVAFATFANVVHVVKGNRIIASMTPHAAKKAGMSDVYLGDQFQDVVAMTMDKRGLRAGLIKSGFALAKVKIASSKVQAKVISARVDTALKQKLESAARQDKAMDQALAIAAVGVNRRFFKDTPNDLKASLETELQRLGVRGGSNLVRACFAEHGVAYAQSIVALAKKLAAMPEEHRNQFADALDITEDSEYEDPLEAGDEEDFDGVEIEDDMEPVPASLTAALLRPAQRSSNKVVASTSAISILTSNRSLAF
jgi:hypothetical protein